MSLLSLAAKRRQREMSGTGSLGGHTGHGVFRIVWLNCSTILHWLKLEG